MGTPRRRGVVASALAAFAITVLSFAQGTTHSGPSGASGASSTSGEYSNDTKQFKDVDASKLTEVQLDCKDDGGSLGRKGCKDFIDAVIQLNKKRLSVWTWNYYHGKIIDPVTGDITPVQGPVCNLAAGEFDKNQFGESCGPMCEFKVSTLSASVDVKGNPPAYCVREGSWGKGATLQGFNHYKEMIYQEFRAKKLILADFDGVKPCAEQAADVLRITAGRDQAEAVITKNAGGAAKAKNMTCQTSDGTGGEQTVCLQQMGNKQLEALWELLLGCEINARTIKDAYTKYQNRDAMMGEVKGVAMNCALQVAACLVCPDSAKDGILNNCYKNTVPDYLNTKMKQWWPTSEPLEKPIDPGSSDGKSSTQNTPLEGTAYLLMASLGSFFRKRREQFRLAGMALVALLSLSTVTFFTSTTMFANSNCTCGCDCGSCCKSCCMGCVDCPARLAKAGVDIDKGKSSDKMTGEDCQKALKKQQDKTISSENRDDLSACINEYCKGVQAAQNPQDPTNGQTGAAAGSFGSAGSAAPIASQAAGNFNAAGDLSKKPADLQKAANAATAGFKDGIGTKSPNAGGSSHDSGRAGGLGVAPTAGGVASTTGGGAGNGNSGVGGGSASAGGADGAAAGGSGGPTEIDTKQAGFDSTGAGGGGRGGGGGGGGNPFGGLFGGGGGGPQGGVGLANFGAGANTTANGGVQDIDIDSYLKRTGNHSLFEIVNIRMGKFGEDINR